MLRTVEFHPAALIDAEAALEWYRKRSERAASRFLAELELLVGRLEAGPERYPEFHAGTRRVLFRRFPYYVVFRCNDLRIEVIAVAHGRRRPGFWASRLDA